MTNALDDHVVAEIPHQLMDDFLLDIERAVAARKWADPGSFFDVYYKDLIEDPVGVIRQIYEYFSYSFSEEFEARIIKWLEENPKEKHGTHRYSLEQFGLTPDSVTTRFADYCKEFDVVSD
jgi:hypothetical protein